MVESSPDWLPVPSRARLGWWLYVLVFVATFLFVLYRFVGMFVLGVFGYYATRPLYDRISGRTDAAGLAAGATVLFVVLPIVLLLAYAGFTLVEHLSAITSGDLSNLPRLVRSLIRNSPIPNQGWREISGLVRNPIREAQTDQQQTKTLVVSSTKYLAAIGRALLTLTLALALTFYLLRDDDRIAGWFRENVADEESTAYAYALAVDGDLETLYYGNLLFVAIMSVIAAAVYLGANFIAPAGLRVPLPLVLAVLTGITALVPLLVSKVVYVPLVGYLAWAASSTPGNQMWFPLALLGVSVVLLDLAPQMLIQPYVAGGHQIHMGLMLFAYVLGPILFGWYGFFYLPLLVVLGVELVRVVVTELLHGDRLTPTVTAADSLSSDVSDHPEHREPVRDGSLPNGSADEGGTHED